MSHTDRTCFSFFVWAGVSIFAICGETKLFLCEQKESALGPVLQV